MRTVIVANPQAAAGKVKRDWHRYHRAIVERLGPSEVRFTSGPNDATRIVREAIAAGAERVVVVGGDGTINEAVNGFFDAAGHAAEAELVVFPGGTGSDFARSVGLQDIAMVDALKVAQTRRIDVGRAELTAPDGEPRVRYFINISSFGCSGLVVDKVNKTSKALGGKLSFFVGTLRGMLAYKNQRVRLRVDDSFEEELVVNTVAIANGRYFGGSMMVAPAALVDDGVFDIVIIGDVGTTTFLRYSGALYKGEHMSKAGIRGLRGKRVQATPLGDEPVLIDLDGEQPGRLPVTYEVLPGALKLCAPWDRAEAVRR